MSTLATLANVARRNAYALLALATLAGGATLFALLRGALEALRNA
jgi:hypothetical protein